MTENNGIKDIWELYSIENGIPKRLFSFGVRDKCVKIEDT